MVKSAGRVIQILKIVGSVSSGMKHCEIAKKLDIPKGSLSFLLADLVSGEFLRLDDEGRYKIGSQILILANSYLADLDIIKISEGVLKEIVEATNESVGLALPKGNEVVIVAKLNAIQQLKIEFEIGQLFRMYSSAAGKSILAHLDSEALSNYLSTVELVPVTSKTIVDPDKLITEIQEIRETHIAYSLEENIDGRIAIAAPVFNNTAEIIASIVQAVPTVRYNIEKKEKIKQALISASKKLSTAFGYIPPIQ
ncbi:MAG: IclR family transcriptional regulator [Spirochaetes bacterium]|nr:IclR family transcriptional regulator [Spirochaetota bacterium]